MGIVNTQVLLTKNTLPSTWDGDVLLSFPSKQYSQGYSISQRPVLNSGKDVLCAQQPREKEQDMAKEHRYNNFPSFTFQ